MAGGSAAKEGRLSQLTHREGRVQQGAGDAAAVALGAVAGQVFRAIAQDLVRHGVIT